MNALMRTIGSVVAAVAVALVVVGSTVGIAAATPRDDAVAAANDFIDGCFLSGGDPVVVMDSTGESIAVYCIHDDGKNSYVCTFDNGITNCQSYRPISSDLTSSIPVDGLTQVTVLDESGGPTEPTAGPTAQDAQLRVAAPDDDQKHATSKQGKHGKHGKHGKGRK